MGIPNQDAFNDYHEKRRQKLAEWNFSQLQSQLRLLTLGKISLVLILIICVLAPAISAALDRNKAEAQKEIVRETILTQAVDNMVKSSEIDAMLTVCSKCHRAYKKSVTFAQVEEEYERIFPFETRGEEADRLPARAQEIFANRT